MGNARFRSVRLFGLPVICLVPFVAGAFVEAAAAEWKPDHAVELVVQSAPGGGTDITARLIQKIWQTQRMVEVPVSINNKAGGGGNVALAYLNQHPGDGHMMQIASAAVLTGHITGASSFNYTNFTPLAQLNSEYLAFAVKADSPIKTGKDLIERLGKNPASLSIAIGTAAGGVNHVAAAQVAKAGGADPRKLKVVVFKSSSESVTALMGGHVDLVVSSASVVAPFTPGQVRLIALSAPHRMAGALADVPTWKEQGVDIVLDNFRMVIGSPKMTAEQIAYWDGVFAKLLSSPEWKQELDSNLWEGNTMRSSEVGGYLANQYESLKGTLSELGMAK
jgi:putative tricarboxylic transport membrane protein